MILKNVIQQRRSTKAFLPNRSISKDNLLEILRSGTLAPSGFNLQPWRFIVIQAAENKEKLYSCAFEQEQIKQASVILICCGDRQVFMPEYVESVLKLGKESGSMSEQHARFLRQTIPTFHKFHPSFESIEAWTNRQVMIAVTHMMLVAKSLGIDSCIMEGFVTRGIRENFCIPKNLDICCLLALGYTVEQRQFGGRFSIDKICYQESYSKPISF